VIGKLLEAFFRHKLLLMLPPILIPLIVGPIALRMAPEYYESWMGVWVARAGIPTTTMAATPGPPRPRTRTTASWSCCGRERS